MLISSRFCKDSIRLLFTIFTKTVYPEIKSNILFHFGDLLSRFPNIVEPWSTRVYDSLRDEKVDVRYAALYTISSLILKDMIRAHDYMAELASSIIDPNQEISQMARYFFVQLSQKDNNLANVIPDIFTYLVNKDENVMSCNDLRSIMK